jgi:hypothetical protein
MATTSDVLNILKTVGFDDSIVSLEYHTYTPLASNTYGFNDEIRISINNPDLITIPSQSYLHIEGICTATKKKGDGTWEEETPIPNETTITENGFAYLFSNIFYQLSNTPVDQTKNPGINTTLKGLVSRLNETDKLKYADGWDNTHIIDKATGRFDVAIPLKRLLGFCEEYKNVIVNVPQELILIRSNTDSNCYITNNDSRKLVFDILKIYWRIPHVVLNDAQRYNMLQTIRPDPWIPVEFKTWELHEYPLLNQTDRHTWTVKTTPQLHTPRYIILAFQTKKRNDPQKDASLFDHINLVNAKLYLNGVPYPYDNLNLDFSAQRWNVLYQMYANFQCSYYKLEESSPILSLMDFKNSRMLVVIDCSHQPEAIKGGTVDVRLEWETKGAVPADTAAYCLILHDAIINYQPLAGSVQIL